MGQCHYVLITRFSLAAVVELTRQARRA